MIYDEYINIYIYIYIIHSFHIVKKTDGNRNNIIRFVLHTGHLKRHPDSIVSNIG